MAILISAVSFVFVFIIVALAHEMGHFIWAKRSGIRVLEFGIGYGPTLFKKRVGETVYSINLIPILAFVRLAGIDEETEDEKDVPQDQKYFARSPWDKFRAIASGPAMNICLGFLIYSVLAATAGLPALSPRIEKVMDDSPALRAGLRRGDVIAGFNGKKADDMSAVIDTIHKSFGTTVVLNVLRDGRAIDIKATPMYDKKYKVGLLGFSLSTQYKKFAPAEAVWAGAEKTASIMIAVIVVFFQLITGKVSIADLAGPIGIAQFSGQAAMSGFATLMNLTAFISINLGVLNLLPIPALDGGRLVFVFLEWVRRKPINIDAENRVHQWGLVALLALMAIVSFNDIARLIRLGK